MRKIKGIELSEAFYREYGEPMIKESFPELCELIAVGLAGSGSECFGYDDEISEDHDFEPGFCIFLPDEETVSRRAAFLLERAYSKLPKEFWGYKRSPLSPVGGNRHGVVRMSEFFKDKTGTPDGALELLDWFYVPEQSLAEATNGRIFFDGLGLFTKIRESLAYMPEDVRLKKLAGELLTMAQSGQYNYPRCVARGETGAAQLALAEFVKSAIHVAFLLNKRYQPYYKWSFYALRALPTLSELAQPLEYLISSGNGGSEFAKKQSIVENVCQIVIAELCRQSLTDTDLSELEAHAYRVNGLIGDSEIRNKHILFAI